MASDEDISVADGDSLSEVAPSRSSFALNKVMRNVTAPPSRLVHDQVRRQRRQRRRQRMESATTQQSNRVRVDGVINITWEMGEEDDDGKMRNSGGR